MPGFNEYEITLIDRITGSAIHPDGKFKVVTAGTATPVTITTTADAAITQPGTIADGSIQFRTAESVSSVDVYFLTDTGYAGVVPGLSLTNNRLEHYVDTGELSQTIQIPMKVVDDGAAATELDTGFDLVTDSIVMPTGVGARVITIDATEDIDVGILSTESGGDADGFLDALSVATAGYFTGGVTVTTGSNTKFYAASPTLGALLADHQAGTDVDQDEGLFNPKTFRCNGTAKSISVTFSTGSDTAAVILIIPTRIPKVVRT